MAYCKWDDKCSPSSIIPGRTKNWGPEKLQVFLSAFSLQSEEILAATFIWGHFHKRISPDFFFLLHMVMIQKEEKCSPGGMHRVFQCCFLGIQIQVLPAGLKAVGPLPEMCVKPYTSVYGQLLHCSGETALGTSTLLTMHAP